LNLLPGKKCRSDIDLLDNRRQLFLQWTSGDKKYLQGLLPFKHLEEDQISTSFIVFQLLPLLHDYWAIEKVVQSLSQIGQVQGALVASELLPLLRDQNSGICKIAAEILGQIGQNQSALVVVKVIVIELLYLLTYESNRKVRVAAEKSLGQISEVQVTL